MEVNIELKTGVYWYPEIEKKTIEIVKKAGMEERVIYSSFNHYSVQKILSMDTKAETAYLYTDVMLDVESMLKNRGTGTSSCCISPIYVRLYETLPGKRFEDSCLDSKQRKDMKNFMRLAWKLSLPTTRIRR